LHLSVKNQSNCQVEEITTFKIIFIQKAEPFEVEIAIAKLKRYKSSGSDQIVAKRFQAGGEILHSKIHKLFNFIGIWKNCLVSGRSL
jgi:hypothetical protein